MESKMNTAPHTIASFKLALAVAALVLAADLFFYKDLDGPAPFGWTVGVYGLILTASVWLQYRRARSSLAARLLALALVVLSLGMLVEPSTLGFLWGLHGVVVLAVIGGSETGIGFGATLFRWLEFWATGWTWLAADARRYIWSRYLDPELPEGGPSRLARFVKAWVLPGFLGAIFLMLFVAANPVLELWNRTVAKFLSYYFDMLSLPPAPRVFFWVACSIGLWALLRSRFSALEIIRKAKLQDSFQPLLSDLSKAKGTLLAPSEVARYLMFFNAIFAVQTVMDVWYLWGGAELPSGMTYAEYAHRGSYPLIAAALFAAAFVLAVFRSGDSSPESARARRWVYLWLGQNLLLALGAGWRLHLYVEAYTLTRLRVAAAVWMLIVVLGLVWIVLRIVRGLDNAWLLRMNVCTVAVVLYLCALMNFDGMIAWHNVRNCREAGGRGVPADLEYLGTLGWKAAPALEWLAERLEGEETGPMAKEIAKAAREALEVEWSDYRGRTLRRAWLRSHAP